MANVTNKQKFSQDKVDLERDLDDRLNSDNLPDANIIIAGITGTGKSTLINAVFGTDMAATGRGEPVTEHISEYSNENIPIHVWDTVGLELNSDKTKESIKSIKATIAEKATSDNQYDRIHAIWYCINSGSNRYQGAELDFINELHSIGVPFIIVLTQCSGDEETINEFEINIKKINESKGMGDIEVVQVLAMPVKYRGIPEPIPAFGLDTLVDTTLNLLPDFIKSGFVAAQQVSLKVKRNQSEEFIYDYVEAAQNGFWDKIPLANIFTTDRKIVNMLIKIGKEYNTVLSEVSIERIKKDCKVDFKNNFWGLISPIDFGYSKKISALLAQKKEEGFSVDVENVDKRNRAARMIAFYGYTFVDSIEELWDELTVDQLKNVEMVVSELTRIINQKLTERKAKGEEKQ